MCQLLWYEQLLPAAGEAAPPSARAPAASVATPSVVSLFISATPFSSFPGDRNRAPVRELRCGGAIAAWTRQGAGLSSARMDVCYRHPDRETGVSCSSCGRPICPDCMTTTPVGMRCPECARERTPIQSLGPAGDVPRVTYALIAINVAVALASLVSGAHVSGGLTNDAIHRDGELSR